MSTSIQPIVNKDELCERERFIDEEYIPLDVAMLIVTTVLGNQRSGD